MCKIIAQNLEVLKRPLFHIDFGGSPVLLGSRYKFGIRSSHANMAFRSPLGNFDRTSLSTGTRS